MQQRTRLQTPCGKVNNDLCQTRSVRGKSANFHVECRGLFVVETFEIAVFAIKRELAKLSFNNTLCKYRANGVNLQTNTNRATLRQLSKQQGVLPWANCLTLLARWQRLQKEACCNVQTFPFVQKLVVLACKKYSKIFENFAEKCLTYFLRCSIIYRLSA